MQTDGGASVMLELWGMLSILSFAVWLHYLDANKTAGEKARRQLHKNAASNIEQILVATPQKAPTIRPPASHHENYPS